MPNNACGLSFAVDDWTMLRRFLALGSEGGSYYFVFASSHEIVNSSSLGSNRVFISQTGHPFSVERKLSSDNVVGYSSASSGISHHISEQNIPTSAISLAELTFGGYHLVLFVRNLQ